MIKIISTATEWRDILNQGLEYNEIYIASYEIGKIGSIYTKLKNHKEQIKCIAVERIMNNVVDKNFENIDKFLSSLNQNEETVYYKFQDHTFHPKTYYFRNSDSQWLAIVGSPNFTHSAFNNNVETAIAFNQNCPSAEDVRRNIEQFFNDIKEFYDSLVK